MLKSITCNLLFHWCKYYEIEDHEWDWKHHWHCKKCDRRWTTWQER